MARKKGAGLYYTLPDDALKEMVKRLMAAGGSNASVAKELGTNPNTIASYRHRKGIPSRNEAPFKRQKKEKKKMRPAASEATQCKARVMGHQCAWEREPGSDYCALPHHQALEKRHPARR